MFSSQLFAQKIIDYYLDAFFCIFVSKQFQMHLQYISDNKGITTGVFLPIQDWQYLKNKYAGIEKEVQEIDIHSWHKNIVDKRLSDYMANPNDVIDFDKACDDIISEL